MLWRDLQLTHKFSAKDSAGVMTRLSNKEITGVCAQTTHYALTKRGDISVEEDVRWKGGCKHGKELVELKAATRKGQTGIDVADKG
jgi:hypothetical protein